jgi:hypothetical protein
MTRQQVGVVESDGDSTLSVERRLDAHDFADAAPFELRLASEFTSHFEKYFDTIADGVGRSGAEKDSAFRKIYGFGEMLGS